MRPALAALALACACEQRAPAVVAPTSATPRAEPARPVAVVEAALRDAARAVVEQDRGAREPLARCDVTIEPVTLAHVSSEAAMAAALAPDVAADARPCNDGRCRGATVLSGASGPGVSQLGLAVPAPTGGWWVWPQAASELEQYHCTSGRWGALLRDDVIVHARVGIERTVVVGVDPEGNDCEVDVDAQCMIGCMLAGRDDLELLVDARSGAALRVTRAVRFEAPRAESSIAAREQVQLRTGDGVVEVRGCGTAQSVAWPPDAKSARQ
ncbi:MAG: hypothetical protein K1X88_13610 [Nannocystaceae bacterium]|nr:hypothetical protein [Nannocystaceae bacterium]